MVERKVRKPVGNVEKAPPGFEPGVADLQSAALPLGEGAVVATTLVVSAAWLTRLEP